MPLLRVHAGPHARRFCPVSVELNISPNEPVTLFQEPGHRPRACQLQGTQSGCRLWWIVSRLDAGETMNYRLAATPDRRKPLNQWRWTETAPAQWELARGSKLVARYRGEAAQAFAALGPLFAPGDADSPVIDTVWSSASLTGTSHHATATALLAPPFSGPVLTGLQRRAYWLGPNRERLVEEFVTWTWFKAFPEARLIDIALALRASVGPVQLAASRASGLLTARLPLELWTAPEFALQNSAGGQSIDEVQGRPADWLAAAAKSGVAIFNHPNDLGSPAIWHISEDGGISANPFGAFSRFAELLPEQDPRLAAGEVLSFRYRLCLHSAPLNRAALRGHYLNFAFPPWVEIVERS
jgi:hypothetical protein